MEALREVDARSTSILGTVVHSDHFSRGSDAHRAAELEGALQGQAKDEACHVEETAPRPPPLATAEGATASQAQHSPSTHPVLILLVGQPRHALDLGQDPSWDITSHHSVLVTRTSPAVTQENGTNHTACHGGRC